MFIKTFVDDAIFLRDSGHEHSALLLLLSAIGASSRKTYTKDEVYRDGVAYTKFLGPRLREILFSGFDVSGESGFKMSYSGETMSLEHFIYTYFRCNIAHEGALPNDVRFVRTEGGPVENSQSALQISFSDGCITFNAGLLDLLVEVVVGAKCNAAEFGRVHYELRKRHDFDEETFVDDLKGKVVFGYRREVPFSIYLLKEFIFRNPEVDMTSAPDEQIVSLFKQGLQRRQLSGGAAVSYVASDMLTEDYTLTDTGLFAVREVAQKFVAVSI